jgi:hypothetical protein
MNKAGYGLAAFALVLVGCHTITEELPTQPTKTTKAGSNGILTVPIPAIPGATPAPTPKPTPTPAPAPTSTPTPAPNPTPVPGTSGSCGAPLPVVTRMNGKIHIKGPNRYTLDSTPITGPDGDYCRQIGYTDGRLFCPVRTEGAPDRQACEEYAVGRAEDTNRPGPTWYINGQLCDGVKCENHEDNQYLLYAMASGNYQACTKDDICVTIEVAR